MSHNRRRREESSWQPGYGAHYDDYSWRHYAPPADPLPGRSFNYWREEASVPPSYHPRGSYGRDSRESYNEQWRDDHSRQSSYPRRPRDSGPGRDWGDLRESRRDRTPPYRNSSRHHAPEPYISRSQATFRARRPPESMPRSQKPALTSPPSKATPPPSEPPKPSPGYLSLSDEPSQILFDSMKTRRLLVLDLNGTLLIRSPRSRVSSGPQLRPVQPRPYMQSFRQYLFCADTMAWLDTMVWSSAQPHSVDDMVDKVFGTSKDELKAVWNRKSLGLSEAEYHRKTVTTKDLAKAWDLFASASDAGKKIDGRSAGPSQSKRVHSALTTLLLDDSPHKAVLQPYNHVCIPEYDSTRRQHDLRSFLATKGPKESKQSKKERRKHQVEAAVPSINQTVLEPSQHDALPESAEKESYDVILLAVIGILEAVKLQSNVAGWIRKGGLWATQERGQGVGALHIEHRDAKESKTDSGTVVGTGNDASSTSDPAVTSEQAHLRTKMWFDDASVVAYWVGRGRKALMELGIQGVHGVTG